MGNDPVRINAMPSKSCLSPIAMPPNGGIAIGDEYLNHWFKNLADALNPIPFLLAAVLLQQCTL